MDKATTFIWEPLKPVERFCLDAIDGFKEQNGTIARFEKELADQTSTRLLDWIDHLTLSDVSRLRRTIEDLGFRRDNDSSCESYHHPGTRVPRLVIAGTGCAESPGIALKVENIADFLQANQVAVAIEGEPWSPYRRASITTERGITFSAVERRGSRGYEPGTLSEGAGQRYVECLEAWQTLPRFLPDETAALSRIETMATQLVSELGQNRAADLVCNAERHYWFCRNRAGRTQKSRQDSLGLGWANHDHHTFRSSRSHFAQLVALFTCLGFQKREHFYAGKEAGWGALVMENPVTGIVLFLDVDLAPEEVAVDFAGTPLKARETLGTVGLWCALHGDSILGAGMHHLAANFEFHSLIGDLSASGIGFMAPFSDLPYLKQCFSEGEPWAVHRGRIAALLDSKQITQNQGDKFLQQGAIGSHLENIARRQGYKGFNQKNVSTVIRATDPRIVRKS